MILAIVGSRSFNDYYFFESKMFENFHIDELDYIVSGGAFGVDALAYKFGKNYRIETIIHRPDYSRYYRKAPLIRNKLIVNDCDRLIAFWDMKSRGTFHTINIAKKQNKLYKIIKIS